MYLLDTGICIDFMRGNLPYAYDLMRKSDPRLFKIPSVVEGELRAWAETSDAPQKTRWLVEEFLLPFETLPFDHSCALAYAKLRAQLEKAGTTLDSNDLLIAATAVANGAVLVTNNAERLKLVPGLSLESWHEMSLSEQPGRDDEDQACTAGSPTAS